MWSVECVFSLSKDPVVSCATRAASFDLITLAGAGSEHEILRYLSVPHSMPQRGKGRQEDSCDSWHESTSAADTRLHVSDVPDRRCPRCASTGAFLYKMFVVC